MAVDAARVVPTGLVVTVIGYCVWPYLLGSPPPADPPPAVKPPEISPAMLTAVIPPLPDRDPFHAADVTSAAKRKAASLLAAKKPPPGRTTPGGALGPAAAIKVPPKIVDPRQGMALEATCLSDYERLAIINGRIYRQRETVRSPAAGAPTCVLAQVLRDKVLLSAGGKTLELKYSNASGSAASGEDPAAGAKRSGSTAAPRGKKSSPKTTSKSH
jgi:hypothetical protein